MTHWPTLDFASEQPVYETVHLYLQLIGKLPTRLHPWINHGWHVALRVTPHGFMTRTMPVGARSFTVELDCHKSEVIVRCDGGDTLAIALSGQSVARLQSQLREALSSLNLPAPLHGAPNELPEVIPFAEDRRDRSWDREVIGRLHDAFRRTDAVFNQFRALYLGKSSPSHLFWGSFDLAVTRFSGRDAPTHPGGFPNLPDAVTREAYSHEVISAGFWLGGGGVDEAAFYAYAYPSPAGASEEKVAPDEAYWHGDLGEFILPYAVVAASDDPEAALFRFLESTYAAFASRTDWPKGLTTQTSRLGQPPPRV